MFEKKKQFAEKLLERDITMIYIADEGNTVFLSVNPEKMSSEDVAAVLEEEQIELEDGILTKGVYHTKTTTWEGYWCDLKKEEEQTCL